MLPAIARSPLAIDGARPLRTAPFSRWPYFAEDEIEAAVEVMHSGQVNYCTGIEGRAFECEFAKSVGCRYAVAVANGTVALELALRSLRIGPGDEVITPSRTFVASATSVRMCGACPVFAEIDGETQNLTGATIEAALTPRTKAIIAVHLGGSPCDMDCIMELARNHGLFVIEDCAQAQGATWKGRPVGSFGDAAAFSFCQDKIMTTLGEGGMLTTNRAELRDRSCSFRDHGRRTQTGSQSEQDQTGKYGFRWVHDTAGTNWRITEVQSAVGRVQLRKVPQWLAARRAHARMLTARLGRISALRIPMLHEGGESAWYRFYVFVRPEVLARGWNRDRILEAINAEGIPCFVGSCSEVYLELAFSDIRPVERFPIARQLGETSLAFLVHPTLTPADIEDSCSAIEKVMTAASSQ